MELKYSIEQVQSIIDMLDNLVIKGVDSANKMLQIVQILNSPIKDIKADEGKGD